MPNTQILIVISLCSILENKSLMQATDPALEITVKNVKINSHGKSGT